MFGNESPGQLVAISGGDERGSWRHQAFVPNPLPLTSPDLTGRTYRAVAEARAALAALDSTARQLPEPTLFRQPALRREAQSTSALEGTYAPLARVLEADEESPDNLEMREILNYVRMAEHGFGWIAEGRPLSASLILDLQGILMQGMPLEPSSGRVRDVQVVIGQRQDADPSAPAVEGARFVPSPPGTQLEADLRAAIEWIRVGHSTAIDPVVAAAMAHYQFETLHPFRDGNGRIGRYLIVLHLLHQQVLSEPTLTVSPWFEARRTAYYDRLLAVSTDGDWDNYVSFFATGLQAAADLTRWQMLALSQAREDLRAVVRASKLRADTAVALIDVAVARPTFTVPQVHETLGVSYARANTLVSQLMELGVLNVINPDAYKRRFYAPRVLDVILNSDGT